ncbi:MAG: HRDC domain-containing protein [Nitrospirota bacterium]
MEPARRLQSAENVSSPPTVQLIERQDDLAELAVQLAGQPRIAVDSESDSFHHYQEKVCLIQLSIPGRTFVLDPLRLASLDPLLPVFADPAVEKVLHGADYDIRTLGRDYGVKFENLFDTMIAAQLLGQEAIGLAALLKGHFGVELDKKFQKADWSRRPLPPEMLRYAADDTGHLIALRGQLDEALERAGRRAWHREECGRLVLQKAGPRQPPSCFSIKGAGRLEPRQLAVLQALLEMREEIARANDRPPFKVISNETLMALAVRQPATLAELASIIGMTPKVVERLGASVIDAIRRGQTAEPGQLPRRQLLPYTPLKPAQDAQLKRLKEARQRIADQLKLQPGILCSGAVLEELVRMPQPAVEQAAARLATWRWAVLGEAFTRILAPETATAG